MSDRCGVYNDYSSRFLESLWFGGEGGGFSFIFGVFFYFREGTSFMVILIIYFWFYCRVSKRFERSFFKDGS